MDFVINGSMIDGNQGAFRRYHGIIGSNEVEIVTRDENGIRTAEINEPGYAIRLYSLNEEGRPMMIGGIYTYLSSLLFDYDDDPNNGYKYRILPQKLLDKKGITNPYEINIEFTEEDHSLINIYLELNQNVHDRKLHVEMRSKVRLRN